MKVTLLGCGNSGGTPLIGCDCKVCLSDDPKNKRTRASLAVEIHGKTILIDSSPDLRQQALTNRIRRIDAVLYTHAHADHANGLDDLRSFNYLVDNPIPIYGNADTLEELQRRFPYAFLPKPTIWYRPCLTPHVFSDAPVQALKVGDIPVTLFTQMHGKIITIGYRIGTMAYSTDVDAIPEASFAALEGLDVWFVDCLKYAESYSHACLEQALRWIERVKPKLAVLTHMAHDFDYETLRKSLPNNVVPGYDGLCLTHWSA